MISWVEAQKKFFKLATWLWSLMGPYRQNKKVTESYVDIISHTGNKSCQLKLALFFVENTVVTKPSKQDPH